ncbi:hypothetical protein OAS39_05275 [Pirellulales bacterium]|nr:hypothetical protein [Pirellulales bacterium]
MAIPQRIYEPNIIHNPFKWMGIWTPQGWRVHPMRWGQAERLTVFLSGDGCSTFFPEALLDPRSKKVEWSDDLHLADDPFTDGGIYPCEPRVEYPAGRPRWAISHTLLCYPVADHALHTHEYTWDLTHGHLQTHFRRHVALEEARTDDRDGRTVTVRHRPICTTIEGNVQYPLPNSAVRGVWADPEKTGRNYYTRRAVQLLAMHNAVYCITPYTPVVQCHGMYATSADDPLDAAFDRDTGLCRDEEVLLQRLLVPVDEPRLGMLRYPIKELKSAVYEGLIGTPADLVGTVDRNHLQELRARMGSRFEPGRVGYALANHFDGDGPLAPGYLAAFDYNNDGLIDEDDLATLSNHLGRRVRYNLYLDAYFGADWLTTSACLEPEHRPGIPVIADYEYGGGYDAQAGIIRLLETPGSNRQVWVEYHYDAPAEVGENNICIHLYHEKQ